MRRVLVLLLLASAAYARVDTQSATDADTFCSGPADKEICFDKNGNLVPTTDNNQDLGTSSLEWKDLYLDGTATIDDLQIDNTITGGSDLVVVNDALTVISTLTVIGNAFSVGGSTVVVTGGKVGIGTTSPAYVLDIGSGTTIEQVLRVRRGSDDTTQGLGLGYDRIVSQRTGTALASAQTTLSFMQQGSDGYRTNMTIGTSGNIGVGTTNPTSRLSVHKTWSDVVSTGSAAAVFGDFTNDSLLKIQTKATAPNAVVLQAGDSVNNNGTMQINPAGGTLAIGNGGTPLAVISTFTYTPLCTIESNLDACTPGVAVAYRVGNLVTVAGSITLDATSGSDDSTLFELSLSTPNLSNFSADEDVSGTFAAADRAQRAGAVYPATASDHIQFRMFSQQTAATVWQYHYTYVIK